MSQLGDVPVGGAAVRNWTLSGVFSRLSDLTLSNFAAERSRWVLWLPVLLACGIGTYFSLKAEPPVWLGSACAAAIAVMVWRCGGAAQLAGYGALAFAIGFSAAQFRTWYQDTPVIAAEIGPVMVTGRVVRVEGRENGTRWLIAPTQIGRLKPEDLPARIRLTVRGADRVGDAVPGDLVTVRAVLMPPPTPVKPGGFDYGRLIWFERIGAVGYAFSPPRPIGRAVDPGWRMQFATWVFQTRMAIAEHVRRTVPGDSGAVAAALMTGDRGAIPKEITQQLRDSGLAHLLAISGLHMGLIAGTLFFVVRAMLALIEPVALRYPIKKWSATVALAGACVYLLMSGATIPTQRAFIMTSMVLVAVILDRAALSMWTIAVAATAILLLKPESLLHVGFQMSFAAVVALVAVYERYGDRMARRRGDGRVQVFLRYMAGIAFTSLIAGLATALFAAYHFNRVADFGLAANMAAMPLMSMWIMPNALLAFALMPFGLDTWPLLAMAAGIEYLLGVAAEVASWPGAVTHIGDMPLPALILASVGGLWLCIWVRPWRLVGLALMAVAIGVALLARPPDILVSADGELIAVRGQSGEMVVNATRKARYTRRQWALSEGRGSEKLPAVQRCDRLGCMFEARNGTVVAHVRDGRALAEDCRMADVVIATVAVHDCPSSETVLDRFDLWRGGAHALWFQANGQLRIEHVSGHRGKRPWVAGRQRSR